MQYLDLLLDSHKLIFKREELIEEEVLRCRSGKEFEKRYLRKGFNDKTQSIEFWIRVVKNSI